MALAMIRSSFLRALRRPSWWLLAAMTGAHGVFFALLVEGSTGSLGEWGRMVVMASVGPPVVFMVLLASGVTKDDLEQREIWGATSSSPLNAMVLGSIGITLAGLLAVLLGVTASFSVVAGVAGRFTTAGVQFSGLYVLWSAVYLYAWGSFGIALTALLKSRWAGIALSAVALSLIWRGFELLLPSNLGAFTPFGYMPHIAGPTGAAALGTSAAMLGLALFRLRAWPEWLGTVSSWKPAVLLLSGAALLATGAVATSALGRALTAPFTSQDLWAGHAGFDQLYLLDADGDRLPVVAGSAFLALRLPAESAVPAWLDKELGQDRELHIFHLDLPRTSEVVEEREGRAITRRIIHSELEASLLILAYPQGKTYPRDLEACVDRFSEAIRPMLQRAGWWEHSKSFQLVIAPSQDFGPFQEDRIVEGVHVLGDTLLVPEQMLTAWRGNAQPESLWGAAWALAEAAALGPSETTYLACYLIDAVDRGQREHALAYFERRLETDVEERVYLPPWGQYNTLYRAGGASPLAVLEHWQRGEEMGHEAYVSQLLEGRDG